MDDRLCRDRIDALSSVIELWDEGVPQPVLDAATGRATARVSVGALRHGRRLRGGSFQEATRRFRRDLLECTLRETDWNVAETARRLDIARSYVYRLIRASGLARGD